MNNQNKRAVDSTAEKTADSIEATIRNMIENEPYKPRGSRSESVGCLAGYTGLFSTTGVLTNLIYPTWPPSCGHFFQILVVQCCSQL